MLLKGGLDMKSARLNLCLYIVAGALALISGSVAIAQETPADYQAVLKELGRSGDYKANVLKVNVPRSDLHVVISGVATPTPFGFGGWVALTKGDEGNDVMMGDLVLLQEEVNPVMSALLENGLDVTALHNHFFWEEPRVFFMHIHGHGKALGVAKGVKPALDLIGHVGSAPASASVGVAAGGALDTDKIAAIVGQKGEQSGAVYKITLGRDDITLKEHGAIINARMGLNTWAAFYGSNADAEVAGDVAMKESEVTSVLKALRKNGLNVVAIHHHMTTVEPTVIFLHYWGRSPAERLATGFKAALDELGSKHAGMAAHSASSTADESDIVNAVKAAAQKDSASAHCAAQGCVPCKGKNCHYFVAKALDVKDCGCGGCDPNGCAMCGPGCDVCKFHLSPNAGTAPAGAEPAKQPLP